MKVKIRQFVCLLFIAAGLLLPLQKANAQITAPCDTCTGVWTTNTTTTFTFSLPFKPGCFYKAYVVYRTRNCGPVSQFEIVSSVFEDLNPPGSPCALSCPDAGALEQVVNKHVLNLIGTVGATFIKITPSPCYYTGKITVPPAAEICFGMTPGTQRTVLVPCDNSGCCYRQLTIMGPTQYYQNAVSSTPCPAAPLIPPSTTIEWSCDILGGGFATFVVSFTPDMPLTCEMLCGTGFYKNASTGIEGETGDIAAFQIYPNPVDDKLQIRFNAKKADQTINVEVLDITGKLVAKATHQSIAGEQVITIGTAILPPGVYTCRFNNGNEEITSRIVK